MGTLLFVQCTSKQVSKRSNKAPSTVPLSRVLLVWLSPSRLIYRFHLLFSQSCPNIIFAPLFVCVTVSAMPIRGGCVFSVSPLSGPFNRQCFRSTNNSRVHIITSNTAIHSTFCRESKRKKNCIIPWTPKHMSVGYGLSMNVYCVYSNSFFNKRRKSFPLFCLHR